MWIDSVIGVGRAFFWLWQARHSLATSKQDEPPDSSDAADEPSASNDPNPDEARAIVQRYRDARDRHRGEWTIPQSSLPDAPERVSAAIDVLISTGSPDEYQELAGDLFDLLSTADDTVAGELRTYDRRRGDTSGSVGRDERRAGTHAVVELQASRAAALAEVGFAQHDLALYVLERGESRVGDGRRLAAEISSLSDELVTTRWMTYLWVAGGAATLALIAFVTGAPLPQASIFLFVLGWIAFPWIQIPLVRALDRRLEGESGDAGMLVFIGLSLLILVVGAAVPVPGLWVDGVPLVAEPMQLAIDVAMVMLGLLFLVLLVGAPLLLVFFIVRGAIRFVRRAAR